MNDLVTRYRARLITVERLSPLTVETYLSEIRRFIEYLEEAKIEAANIDANGIALYLETRRKRGLLDARSCAKALAALRSFFRFAVNSNIRIDDPARLMQPPRTVRREPETLDAGSVDALLAKIDSSTETGLRDKALFELVYSSGLRVSEVSALNVQDVFFAEGVLRITGKGGRERLVPFGRAAAAALKSYLENARQSMLGGRSLTALFVTRNGKRIGRKGIWKNYKALAALNGTSSKVHALRHSFATEMLSRGAGLRSVQELLGHANISTTQIYTHVDKTCLREAHSKYLPKLNRG